MCVAYSKYQLRCTHAWALHLYTACVHLIVVNKAALPFTLNLVLVPGGSK